VQEDTDEDTLFLAIALGERIVKGLKDKSPNAHQMAVLAEEVSHFLLIREAAQVGAQVSLLELEILGEIDRFLILLHNLMPQNLEEMCDIVFRDRIFREGVSSELYWKAEAKAFAELKIAFSHIWDASRCDVQRVDLKAAAHLRQFRHSLLRPRSA
jgi:hypothetical protein